MLQSGTQKGNQNLNCKYEGQTNFLRDVILIIERFKKAATVK